MEKDPRNLRKWMKIPLVHMLEIGEMAGNGSTTNVWKHSHVIAIAGHVLPKRTFLFGKRPKRRMRFWAPTHPSELDGTSREYLGGKILPWHNGGANLYEVWGICLYITIYSHLYLCICMFYLYIYIFIYRCIYLHMFCKKYRYSIQYTYDLQMYIMSIREVYLYVYIYIIIQSLHM